MPAVVGLCPHCGALLRVNLDVPRALCVECRQPFSCSKAFELEAASHGFTVQAGVLTEYWGPDSEIGIPQGVHAIAKQALRDSKLVSVSVPNSVTTIGPWAFEDCHHLRVVNLPDSLTELGQSVFEGCVALSGIALPLTLEVIPERAFARSGIQQLDVPPQVTRIGERAFAGCTKLRQINLPPSVDFIGLAAFQGCYRLDQVDLSPDVAHRLGPIFAGTPWGDAWDTARTADQSARWAANGRCRYCGDEFRGTLVKRCVRCGKKK